MSDYGLRTAPWAHQREAIEFAQHRVGTMLDCDMGVGKTLMALALANLWDARRVLVLSPLSVVGSWERQVREHSALAWDVLRLDRGEVRRKAALVENAYLRRPERLMVVTNHESAWRAPLGALLLAHLWDLVVVDECHRSKAPGGRFSFYLRSLRDRARRRLGLSGTPLPHSPLDAYAQYRFLDPSVYGPSYQRFKDKYATFHPKFPDKVVRWRDLDDFERRFRSIAFHVSKADALDLPPEVDEERTCELEPAARRVYDRVARDFWSDVGAGKVTASNALTRLLRLQQITSGTLKLDDGTEQEISTAKASLFRDLLGDLPKREPVVVFCRFTRDLASVREVAEREGRRYAEVSGNRKDGLTEGAQMRDDVDVLGVQVQAGGVGIDLSRAAVCVFYSHGLSLGDFIQARGRVHRPGQTRPVTYVHLLARDTVDEHVLDALRRREEVIEAVLRRGTKSNTP